MIVTAARFYWNTCAPLINQPIERELLHEPIRELLACISKAADRKLLKKLFETHEDSDGEEEAEEAAGSAVRPSNEGEADRATEAPISAVVLQRGLFPLAEKSPPSVEELEKDLELRAAMYCVVFQAFSDKARRTRGRKKRSHAKIFFTSTGRMGSWDESHGRSYSGHAKDQASAVSSTSSFGCEL